MGQKIVTETDYYMCSQGLMPAQMQSAQSAVKKKSGERYLMLSDTSTSMNGDFMCKYLMLLMAALAALIAVLVVATGGAALGAMMAAGALAGAAGGAAGTVMGGLICGQKAALARSWLGSKNNFFIGGQPTLTTEHKMVCALVGGTIQPIPQVKNFWQASALGLGNWVGEMLQCVMAGAAIGAVGEILVLGPGVFFQGAIGNLVANLIGTWTTGMGLAIRGLMSYSAGVKARYEKGLSDEEVLAESGKGFLGMELGTFESVKRICTGQGNIMDAAGLLLWFSPAGKSQQNESKTKESKPGEEAKANEEAQVRAREEVVADEAPAPDGEAYERGKQVDRKTAYLTEADPVRDVLGPGKKSHPEEWNNTIDELKREGVEVVMTNEEKLAYAPGLRAGEPGQIHLNNDASIGALRHEYQHFLDDKAAGYKGMRGLYDLQFRRQTETNAYGKEIQLMEETGNQEAANKLKENLAKELQKLDEDFEGAEIE